MGALIEVAKLTSKGQVTIPKAVRQTLGVDEGGRIAFEIIGSMVKVTRVENTDADQHDPAIGAFLKLLENDIRLGRIVKSPNADLLSRMSTASLIPLNSDENIEGQVEL